MFVKMSHFCCIPGCDTTRSTPGVKLYKVPHGATNRGYDSTNWSKCMKEVLYKYRAPNNANFKQHLEKGIACICSLHFEENDIVKCNKRSWLKFGALPSKHLPQKSHCTVKRTERRTITKHTFQDISTLNDIQLNQSSTNHCLTIDQSATNIFLETSQLVSNNLPPSWRCLFLDENEFHLILPSKKNFVDDAKVVLYSNMTCHVALCGIPVPCESLPSIKLDAHGFCDFLKTIGQAKLCCGFDKVIKQENWLCLNLFQINYSDFNSSCQRFLSKQCAVAIFSEKKVCSKCCTSHLKESFNAALTEERKETAKQLSPSKKIKNMKSCSKEKLASTLGRKNKMISNFQQKYGVTLNTDLATEDFVTAICAQNKNDTFLSEWWKHQLSLKNVPSSRRRFPASILRYCMKLFNKSPAAYAMLKDTKLLVLPSKQRLCLERNLFKPTSGITSNVLKELRSIAGKNKALFQKNVLLVIDEMKITESLLYRKDTGDLIGFVDYGSEVITNLSNRAGTLAENVLAFYVRGVTNNLLDRLLAYYPSRGLTSEPLYFMLLDAIMSLEMEAGVRVVGIIGDGLSVNHTTFKAFAQKEPNSVSYRMKNPADLQRFIYFIYDPPHLLKTLRNNLMSCNRHLWNKSHLSWEPIKQLIMEDLSILPRRFPRLTKSHAYPENYEKMKVYLAAQVLSSTVGLAVKQAGHVHLAEFLLFVDYWFDLMNTGLHDHKRKAKPQLSPYTNVNDDRIKWLTTAVPEYFSKWRLEARARDDYDEKMLLTPSTEEGILCTSFSMAGLIADTLQDGAQYVITRRCNQDCLESYFGHQRSVGRRNTTPTIVDFGYNANAIHSRKNVRNSNVSIEDISVACSAPESSE